jgi:hypothetical protein
MPYDAITLELRTPYNAVGQIVALLGSIIGSVGTIFISVGLYRNAYILWAVSNPLLLVWCAGEGRFWKDGMSTKMLAGMYGIYIVFNTYALLTVATKF